MTVLVGLILYNVITYNKGKDGKDGKGDKGGKGDKKNKLRNILTYSGLLVFCVIQFIGPCFFYTYNDCKIYKKYINNIKKILHRK